MNKIKCLIVDDTPRYVADLLEEVEKMPDILDYLGTRSDGDQALDFILKNDVDLIFLDSQMPEMSGRVLLRTLERMGGNAPKVAIVLVSQFPDDMVDLNNEHENVLSTIKKPVTPERFEAAMRRVRTYFSITTQYYLCVYDTTPNVGEIQRLSIDNIVYIQAKEGWLNVCLLENNAFRNLKLSSDYHTLTNFMEGRVSERIPQRAREQCEKECQLPNKQFYRPNNSFIINRKHIIAQAANRQSIRMRDQKTIISISNDGKNFNTAKFWNWYDNP